MPKNNTFSAEDALSKSLVAAIEPVTSRVRIDVTAIKRDGKMMWTREPLTKERLLAHVTTGPYRGCCPIKNSENVTRLALYDLDSHKGETPWPEMQNIALQVVAEMEKHGLKANPFRSSGGKGIHLLILWDEPQDAYSARQLLIKIIGTLDYKNGTAGVANAEIEVFPKQNSVPSEGFGNQFILPLAGKSEPLESLFGLEPMGKDYTLGIEWLISKPVPVLEKPARASPAWASYSDNVDLKPLRDALAGTNPDGGYDQWIKIGMVLHFETGGSYEGLQLWDAWSSGSLQPKFKEGDPPSISYDGYETLEEKWESFKPARENPVTIKTLRYLARQAETPEMIAADFSEVETPPDSPAPLPAFTRDKQGKIKSAIRNLVLALRCIDVCGFKIGLDTFRDEIMCTPTGELTWRCFTDADYTRLRLGLENFGFHPIGRELIRDAILLVAEDNKFDSAQAWLTNLTWDGIPRIETFFVDYFGAEDNPYARAIGLYIWTALAGRIEFPGIKTDMTPVLVGPQGIGKSTGIKAICPDEEFFTEIDLQERDENLSRLLRGRLVAEISELRGLRTKDAESIKAFMTRTHEKWIPKYKEFATSYPRHLLFFGTTNEEEFLADETGNRRWLPLEVGKADVDAIHRDRLQLWAEGRNMFRASGILWQEAEKLGATIHEKFRVTDSWEETVTAWLDGTSDELTGAEIKPRDPKFFTINQVLQAAIGIPAKNIERRHEMRLGKVLKNLGYKRTRKRINGELRYVYPFPKERKRGT